MQNAPFDKDFILAKARLLGSLLLFTQTFYKLRTGNDFVLANPSSGEPFQILICRKLTNVFYGKTPKLIINTPPRCGKTEILMHFIAWSIARYPDSKFIFVSTTASLATTATEIIRQIISMPHYRKMFGIRVCDIHGSKSDFNIISDDFKAHGSVYAVGAEGTIIGHGAGIKHCNRFGGAIIVDDIHKVDEAASDITREKIINWFDSTLQLRVNQLGVTPMIFIGQRVHEADLPAVLTNKKTGWKKLEIKGLDEHNNSFDPRSYPTLRLLELLEESKYTFWAQIQQDPMPAGGALFKETDFDLKNEDPEMLVTFIVVDTAETEKTYNDATAFSFFGIYEIKHKEVKTGLYGLHWIDCKQVWVEPRDLESEFMEFYESCMRYKVPVSFASIEKKSTGVTLISILNKIQGLEIKRIERNRGSGGKSDRFISMQRYISKRLVSLSRYGEHTRMCIEHCAKITANNSHRYDDIADTLCDGIRIGIVDAYATIGSYGVNKTNDAAFLSKMAGDFMSVQHLKDARYNNFL